MRAKLRTNQTLFWKLLRALALSGRHVHVPVNGFTRPLFAVLYATHVLLRESFIWMLRFVWYEPLFRTRCLRVGEHFRMEEIPYITGVGSIIIGSKVRLSGKSSIGFGNRVHAVPELHVGDGTFVGHNCAFGIARSIRIGRHCLLAGGVRISDFDGHPMDAAERRINASISPSSIRPVAIGDDVWIGAGTHILKGVTIGDRSIIGAGSIVTRSIPADVVAAGNPARVIKSLREATGELALDREIEIT